MVLVQRVEPLTLEIGWVSPADTGDPERLVGDLVAAQAAALLGVLHANSGAPVRHRELSGGVR